jgi:NitT/TauT family transport system permease protein
VTAGTFGTTNRELSGEGPNRFIDKRLSASQISLLRFGVLCVLLAAWQFAPQIALLRQVAPFMDPFFISSPTLIAQKLGELMTGSNNVPLVWPYLTFTLVATLVGSAIGIVSGAGIGLLLSADRRLHQVLTPFINAVNSVPDIAWLPVIIIICGPTATATIFCAFESVFFTVFFNAYTGGRMVSTEVVQNARLLGASQMGLMSRVRLMYVVLWTFAVLPNAISHGLRVVVTAEILSGAGGLGQLIVMGLGGFSSSLTFAVVIVLSLIGVALVRLAEVLRGRVLHWSPGLR